MTDHTRLRASDHDRELAAQRLRDAQDEGRLLPEEFDERLGLVLRARTYGELAAIEADLPVPAPLRRTTLLRRRMRAGAAVRARAVGRAGAFVGRRALALPRVRASLALTVAAAAIAGPFVLGASDGSQASRSGCWWYTDVASVTAHSHRALTGMCRDDRSPEPRPLAERARHR